MLNIRGLKKTVGSRTLFEDLDLTINYGECTALVGPNGAGKSTLVGLILKEDEPDKGSIVRDEWTTIGFLPQESEDVGDATGLEIATGRAGELKRLEEALKEFETKGETDSAAYFEADTQFNVLNDPAVDAKAQSMLRGLGFRESDWQRPAKELSGGWIMRAHLARLLVLEPELLILDEPTNHLDLVSLLWFQGHLKNYTGAILLISHDREFMDALADSVHDIDDGKLLHYTGNYSAFEEQRLANYEVKLKAYQNQQKDVKRRRESAMKDKGITSRSSRGQSRLKELDKMEMLEKPQPPRKVFKIQFPQPTRGGQPALQLENAEFSYDGKVKIYEGLNLTIDRGDRIVLVGPNGAGKTTLMKMLAGDLEATGGTRKEGHNSRIGYFHQHRAEGMDPNNSVVEEVMSANGELREDEARGVLGSFLFRKEDVFKKVKVLSGGEKTRVNLIKFLVDPPNLLLMDEPTTHLDIVSIEALTVALKKYEGTLVFISHDVHFIRNLASKVLHVSAGKTTLYDGGYDYYLDKTGAENNARAAVTAGGKLSNEQAG